MSIDTEQSCLVNHISTVQHIAVIATVVFIQSGPHCSLSRKPNNSHKTHRKTRKPCYHRENCAMPV